MLEGKGAAGRSAYARSGVDVEAGDRAVAELTAYFRGRTGTASANPIQKRRARSPAPAGSAPSPASGVFGSKSIPQIGQLPGWSCSTSGCMGQV